MSTVKRSVTSARHAKILDDYQQGDSRFNEWASSKLGNFKMTSWTWGAATLDWDIDDRFIMPDGVMFGGHISAVADHIAGLVCMTVLEQDNERFRTSRLETNFFRPLMAPRATINARITNASRTLIHAEADFLNVEGKLAARIYAVQTRRSSMG
jgi:acyl-coenzyme A thioesterase PaaI-like protein